MNFLERRRQGEGDERSGRILSLVGGTVVTVALFCLVLLLVAYVILPAVFLYDARAHNGVWSILVGPLIVVVLALARRRKALRRSWLRSGRQ
jgi:hypothetical protein